MNHPFFRTRHGGIDAVGTIDPALIDAVAIGHGEPEELAFGGRDDNVRWVKFIATRRANYIIRSMRVADRPGCYMGAFAVLYKQEDQACKRAGVELRTMQGDFVIGVPLDEGQACYVACAELDDGMLRSYGVEVVEDDALDVGFNVAYSAASPLWAGDELSADSLQIGIAAPRRHVQEPRPGVDCVFAGWADANGEPIETEPEVVGSYYCRLRGAGSFHGELLVPFALLDSMDIGEESAFDLGVQGEVARGDGPEGLKVSLRKFNGPGFVGEPIVLEPSVDYEIAGYYANASDDPVRDWVDKRLDGFPTACGEYVIEVRGMGRYRGFARELFRVVRDSRDDRSDDGCRRDGCVPSTSAIQARIMANKAAKGFNETNVEQELLLLHGESSEFFDAYRRGDGSVAEELADVAIYTLSIAAMVDIDLGEAVWEKMAVNESRSHHREGNAFVRDDGARKE